MRKIPYDGGTVIKPTAITSSALTANSTITITLPVSTTSYQSNLAVGDSIYLQHCPVRGYDSQYRVASVSANATVITVTSNQTLAANTVTGTNLTKSEFWIPTPYYGENELEPVLLWVYNYKPDSMLLSDPQVYPWLQEYALAFAKSILAQARGKFSQLAGPQGGTVLNGAALAQEAQAEMEKLEEDLKRYVDGSAPLTWVTG